MKIKIFTILLIMVSWGCASQTTDAKPKFFKENVNNITMDVPVGFERVQGQNGFLHKGSASTLMINEISNTPFNYSANHFNAENLEQDGAKLIDKQELKTSSGQDAVLYTLTLSLKSKDNTSNVDFERMVLITGNENTTVYVVANYPVIIKKLIQETMKTSITSVIIN
jgi:hypothetical protein